MELLMSKFEIKKLFGTVDVEIDFSANAKVIVGENGCGKTTILNIIYYTLCDSEEEFSKLKYYDFEEIIVHFPKTKVSIYKDDIISWKRDGRPMAIRRLYRFISSDKVDALIENVKNHKNLEETEEILKRYDISYRRFEEYVAEISTNEENQSSIESKRRVIRSNISGKILYLPTYRRIEDDLGKIEIDPPTRRRLSTNAGINFGMRDVENLLQNTASQILEAYKTGFSEVFVGMIDDVVEKREMKAAALQNKNGVIKTIERIDNQLLDEAHKKKIMEQISEYKDEDCANQEYNYFLNKLLNVFEKQREAENNLRVFKAKCDKYLFNKEIYLDERTLRCIPREKNGKKRELDWEHLSSGEKQIISLFAKLYLDKNNKYIILFDEPEISLSIEWQRTYLADIFEMENCKFLLAVTHSPFIFDNCLDDYAVSLTACMREA